MRLEVNGSWLEVQASTLAMLLDELGFETACVATALNGVFVASPARADTPLADGAKVEVLAPMQGG